MTSRGDNNQGRDQLGEQLEAMGCPNLTKNLYIYLLLPFFCLMHFSFLQYVYVPRNTELLTSGVQRMLSWSYEMQGHDR